MASSIFGPQRQGGIMSRVGQLKGLMKGDPSAVYKQMMDTNPQFRRFVEANRGKTPEQVAQAYGIDLGEVRRMMGA